MLASPRSPTRRRRCSTRRSSPPRPQRDGVPALAVRRALLRARRRGAARGRRGRRACRPARSRSSPTPPHEVTHSSSSTPGWTSSGSPAGRRSSRSPTPPANRASAWARATPRSTSTGPPTSRRVVDILISKTFDASVICPAEQTCIVDEAVYDELVAEFERMGAQLLTDEQPPRWRSSRSAAGTGSTSPRSGSRRRSWPAGPGSRSPRHQGAARPAALRSRRAGRAPAGAGEADAGPRPGPAPETSSTPSTAAVLVTEHGGLGHTSAVYATRRAVVDALREGGPHRSDPGQRADRGRRARRGLQLPHPDVLARLRHLGRVEHHRQRELPEPAQHQDRLAAPHAAAVVPRAVEHVLQRRCAGEPARGRREHALCGHRRARRAPGRRRRGPPQPAGGARPGVQRGRAGADEAIIGAASSC